jgi:plasmid stabilization system protein ParE
MPRLVHLHPGAYADVLQITGSIAHRASAASAARWKTRIESAIGRLGAEADRWPEADEASELGIDLRMMPCGRRPHVYRILFTIDGQTVNVLRVRHTAQDRLAPGDV